MHFKEPWQDIRGLDVQGEQVGTVKDLYVDRGARLPRFLDVSDDGFLGMGKKHLFRVPAEELSREVREEERVAVNQNRDKVVGLPEFDTTRCLRSTCSALSTPTTAILLRREPERRRRAATEARGGVAHAAES